MGNIEDILKLIETFKMERIIYATLTIISALALIGIGVYVAVVQKNYEGFIALLAPTGTMTLCIFRVLKMWDDATKFLIEINHRTDEEKH